MLLWQARATGARRSLMPIVRAEPVWLAVIITLAGYALLVSLPRVVHAESPWAAAAPVILLAALLEAHRPDARLIRILGVHFTLARVVDACLWLAPLLALLFVLRPISGLVSLAGIVAVAVAPMRQTSMRERTHSSYDLLRVVGAIEWAAGLRRAPWPLVISLVVGTAGPAHPLLTTACISIATLTATAYHWAPSEGWLIIDAAQQPARRYLWRKIAFSGALLGLVLAAIAASAVIRNPPAALVIGTFSVACLHAHVCGIVCKYAEYEEGTSLSTAGSLSWFVVTALIVMPPAALLVLSWLERRAVRRLAPFSLSVNREPQ